ncbi:MAG: hypothetical protein JWO26_1492 [Rhodospirillales bacterium]|jgi:hypothetical protein|nr:hypothetical protein [Rhodospirillales bacterium]
MDGRARASKGVPGELHCVDPWQGGAEHKGIEMGEVHSRFRANVQASLDRHPDHKVIIHRLRSAKALLGLHAKAWEAPSA